MMKPPPPARLATATLVSRLSPNCGGNRLMIIAVLALFCFSLKLLFPLLVLQPILLTLDRFVGPGASLFAGQEEVQVVEPQREQQQTRGFSWDDVQPSTSFQWRPCFSDFQCARLSVPLNWNRSVDEQASGPRAAIAVIKLPARVPVTDPRYGGPVIVNPGGPGESGVFQVLGDSKHLQTVLDAGSLLVPPTSSSDSNNSGDKYFDILSFDPRGVNNTTPRLRCYSDAFDQQAWIATFPDYGLLWHSESIIGMEWARASALGASCSEGEESDTGILRHLNTAQTVQDMVQIIEKHGEWRAEEAHRLIDGTRSGASDDKRGAAAAALEIINRTAYTPGEEKIQYWGMSYGTVIGETFAAMHPDRVGRLVLDGVVDPADHYAGAWLTQLQDSDNIISKFCEYCSQAGPESCPLARNGSSAADVEARFTSIMLFLKDNPIAMPPEKSSPALVTYGDVHLMLLSGMYFPFATVETLFELLPALESRNTSSPALARIVSRKRARPPLPRGEKDDDDFYLIPYISSFGPFQAISCMDMGGSRSSSSAANMTRAGFKEFLTILQAQGQWISPSWARNKLSCLGYTVEPAWRPALNFEKQEWDNTSHPLLIIGNTHDTVTPLRNAQRVSTLFPGSVVMNQDSQGHCSHSTPSICTAKVLREYFQTGRLPDAGTTCEPEVRPFIGCTGGSSNGVDDVGGCKFVDGEDAKLWDSMVQLADPFGLREGD